MSTESGDYMTILERIDKLINERGIKRNTLSKEIKEINHNTFYAWETRGTIPNGEILSKIADYFNVSVDYLLGREKPSATYFEGEHKELIELYEKLNATGKQKLLEYAEDLTDNKKYTEEYADELEKRAAN